LGLGPGLGSGLGSGLGLRPGLGLGWAGTIMNSEHCATRLMATLSGLAMAGGGQLPSNSCRNFAASSASVRLRQLSDAACASSKDLPAAAAPCLPTEKCSHGHDGAGRPGTTPEGRPPAGLLPPCAVALAPALGGVLAPTGGRGGGPVFVWTLHARRCTCTGHTRAEQRRR
jgi:hypothetical protein